MGVLYRQLAVVFTVKQMVSQIKQIVKPLLKRSIRMRKENASIKKANKKLIQSQDNVADKMLSTEYENPIEAEYLYEPYVDTFEDFKEMSIQV